MLETIGQQLLAAREQRGLTVEDVAHQTRIHRDVVKRLEADEFSEFPNLMFVKSFLRIYSQFLDLDASHAIAQLAAAEANQHGKQYLLGGVNPAVRETYGHLHFRIPVRPLLASAAAVIALVIGGNYLVSHLHGSDADDSPAVVRSPGGSAESELPGEPLAEKIQTGAKMTAPPSGVPTGEPEPEISEPEVLASDPEPVEIDMREIKKAVPVKTADLPGEFSARTEEKEDAEDAAGSGEAGQEEILDPGILSDQ